jgi:hypothetical protein
MTRSCRLVLPLAALAAVLPFVPPFVPAARAMTSNGIVAQQQWAAMDKCTRQAAEKYPDHTAEDLAKRDEYIRTCQRNQRLPVRQGLSPK